MKSKTILLIALFGLSTIFSSFSLMNSDSPSFFPIVIDNYEKTWEKVDSLVEKRLPKSALKIVEEIYEKAKKENNSPQFIKAVLYRMSLQSDFQEDFLVETIIDIKDEIEKSGEPEKQIFHSMLAEIYWNYFCSNRYVFFQRSETVNYKNDDIKTWDLKKIMNEIISNYLLSIKNPEILKKTSLTKFDLILEKEKESKIYRPALYDFLAHRAVDFFMNDENSLTQPVYKFQIDDPAYFDENDEFVKLNISTKDSLSLKYYAIDFLQKLSVFHLKDKDPTALIDVTLKRLKFVFQNAYGIELKNDFYRNALENLQKQYSAFPASADVSYELAKYFFKSSSKYNPPEINDYKWDKKEAYEICKKTIEKFPNSKGAKNCKLLLDKIQKISFDLITEKVNIPKKPILGSFSYKNISKAYFRIIKLNFESNREIDRNFQREDLIKYYSDLKPDKEFSIDFINDGDFQQHNTQIKIPELPLGFYVILACSDDKFSINKSSFSFGSFWVSNISFIDQKTSSGETEVFVLDRQSGEPIKNSIVHAYINKYNSKKRIYEFEKTGKYISDKNGYVKIPFKSKNSYGRLFLKFTYKNDTLIPENSFYQNKRFIDKKTRQKTFFFTDRAIYRPGQTVYFKGIILEKTGDKYEICTDTKTTVEFFDVNHQKISSLELVSNEYGSVNGTFVAPSGVLLGSMRIKNESGSTHIYVEEYKRPKFEVTFLPVKGSYKLNEKISVIGIAKAYAGNVIDNAKVKFRVVREVRYPYYFWYRSYLPSVSTEIKNGFLETNENGEFTVEFEAIPDKSIDKKNNPVFDFSVYADVTDITSETHSSEKLISVSYKSLIINVDIPKDIDKNKDNNFTISSKNLNEEPEPATGKLSIYKLKQPDKIFRNSNWNRPDVFIINKEEFYKNFPNDIYDDENNIRKWEKEKLAFQLDFDTEKDSILSISDLKNWDLGSYILEIKSKDIFGEEIDVKQYFSVFSADSKTIPCNSVNWMKVLKNKVLTGNNASVLFGTADKKINVLYEIIYRDTVKFREWRTLKNEQKKFEISVTKSLLGAFDVRFTFVKNNRSYQNKFTVTVPDPEQNLKITFNTFRNKILPGSKEEWKINISGNAGEKIAAELLTAMYDASLDAFRENNWFFNIHPANYYNISNWNIGNSFRTQNSRYFVKHRTTTDSPVYQYYDQLNWFGFRVYGGYNLRGASYGLDKGRPSSPKEITVFSIVDNDVKIDAELVEESVVEEKSVEDLKPPPPKPTEIKPEIRRNFNETAFFYPNLQTNKNGDIIIKFTAPESLTRWKFMGLAHSEDLKTGSFEKELVTQKELMVIPNPPRFFREGDTIIFGAKVVGLTDEELSGKAEVQFFDALTMKPIDDLLQHNSSKKSFIVKKGKSQNMGWEISIPEGLQAITYRIFAKTVNFSDGEENTLPVLTNRMLVTESLPLPVKGKGTTHFKFEKLINSKSSTLKNYNLSLEFTSNPAWYAVQALPYMMEYPHECSEQIFTRFYANSIASEIANSSPKIKRVFESWKDLSPDALLSNLEKNQELKSVLLQETPWVLQAKSESERKKRLGLLFDFNHMSNELQSALLKLQQNQSSNGAWPWFKGMKDSRYITQHIVTGFGHLSHLGIKSSMSDKQSWKMLKKAVGYLDAEIRKDYEKILKDHPKNIDGDHLGNLQIQYLYARSYFLNMIDIRERDQKAVNYFKSQADKYWKNKNNYMQGMIALALNRFGNKSTPLAIIKSLKERALHLDEMGMYWRQERGYYWQQAPIETQALLIEAFDEITNDEKAVEEMKIWLLKQKQTQDWKTTKATAEACYALLLRGSNLLESDEIVEITIGDKKIDPTKNTEIKTEAGTGYFKTSWSKDEISPDMGNISITKNDKGVAWGAVYWQYFEDLDKITSFETPLSLEKKLFVERNTPSGPVIEEITNEIALVPGDKIKVRIVLRVDRDMEYIHMKDMRAAAFEPLNVLSGYKYRSGLGYYESTGDAATNFFISYLRKGTYVFEYPLVVSQKGDFSNGITSIQCMYAPEFGSHSEGVRVNVK